MTGLFIIGGLIVIGLGGLTIFKIKWNRADRALARIRADRIEKKRIEAATKAEAAESN